MKCVLPKGEGKLLKCIRNLFDVSSCHQLPFFPLCFSLLIPFSLHSLTTTTHLLFASYVSQNTLSLRIYSFCFKYFSFSVPNHHPYLPQPSLHHFPLNIIRKSSLIIPISVSLLAFLCDHGSPHFPLISVNCNDFFEKDNGFLTAFATV